MLFALTATGAVWADDDDRIDIDRASWSNDRDRLTVRGDKAPDRTTVTIRYGDRGDNGAVIGTTQSDGDGDWEFRISGNDLGTVPCDVTAQASGVDDDDREVSNAPNNCSNNGGAVQPPDNVAPTANANGPYTGTTGLGVSFSSTGSNDSDGTITAFVWNFGDGRTSTAANPSHSYAAAGTFTVTLTVTDNDGATASDSATATIASQPPVNATPIDIDRASWSNDRDRLTVRGDQAPDRTTVTIRYGNRGNNGAVIGTTQSDGDGDWEFRISGNDLGTVPCDVTAQAAGVNDDDREVSRAPNNCSNDGGGQLPANVPPTANANGPYSDINGVEVSFSSAGSNDPDGNIQFFNWTFGDGGSSNSANPNHNYAVAGNYTVRLTVTDSDGATNTDTTSATIIDGQSPPANVAPTANANGPYTGTTGVIVNFSSAGSIDSDGTITSYSWNFGDGSTSTEANPSHDYQSAGNYTVTLTVTDNGNDNASDSDSTTASITDPNQPPVNVPPTAINDSYSTPQATQLNVGAPGVLANDSDSNGDTMTAELRSNPANGSVSLNSDGSFSYTPDNGFTGSDSFSYRANDGQDVSNNATVTITVTSVVVSQCPDPLPTTLPAAHELCTTPYTGPEVCLQCHEGEARDMHGSVHYQQNGPTDFVSNIDGPGGERGFDFAATGINTYCGSHENSPRFTCAGCHVGNGRYPMAQAEFEALPPSSQAAHDQLANIDCLTCHQEQYRRFPNWINENGIVDIDNMFEPLTLENVTLDGSGNLAESPGDTVTRTGLEGIPAVDPITLDFEFAPAGGPGSLSFELPADSPFAPMTITTEVAVQTVHRTTRKSCLSCHAGAAGANGAKRGDLTSLHASPDVGLDQHMSPAGADMTCSDCHSVAGDNGEGHRVRGRGLDLRPNDVAERFTCENSGCHSDRPHANFDFNSPTQDTHAVKVACQTCHIPTYGKGVATETSRDWQDAHLSPSACNGRGGWLPREDKGADLTPSYAWYDGTSEVYFMGQPLNGVPTVPLAADVAQRFVGNFNTGDQAVVLGAPNAILTANGSIDMTLGVNNPDAKLQAMKEHWGKLARNDNTNTLISHSTYDFFRTGDYNLAVESGLAQDPVMNANDPYTVVPVHTFQTLNHGVENRGSALDCNDCHMPLSNNARIDLKNDYGYGLRTGNSAVNGSRISGRLNGELDLICAQCHSNETGGRGFESVHSRHVASRNRDCASCHNFSRLDVRSGLNLNN